MIKDVNDNWFLFVVAVWNVFNFNIPDCGNVIMKREMQNRLGGLTALEKDKLGLAEEDRVHEEKKARQDASMQYLRPECLRIVKDRRNAFRSRRV